MESFFPFFSPCFFYGLEKSKVLVKERVAPFHHHKHIQETPVSFLEDYEIQKKN